MTFRNHLAVCHVLDLPVVIIRLCIARELSKGYTVGSVSVCAKPESGIVSPTRLSGCKSDL